MERFKSSAFHFRDFLEGPVWKDILSEIEEAKNRLFELLSTEENTVEIFRLQGRLDALDIFTEMPSQILMDLEMNVKEKGSGDSKEETKDLTFDDLTKED